MEARFELNIIRPVISACHEDWDTMLPHEKGAFCSSCNKAVQDLTHFSPDELAVYMLDHKGEDICARIPAHYQHIPVAMMQKMKPQHRSRFIFILSLFLAFGPLLFSCNEDEHALAKDLITEAITGINDVVADHNNRVTGFMIPEISVITSTCNCIELDEKPIFEEEPEYKIDSTAHLLEEVYITAKADRYIVGALEYRTITTTYPMPDTIPVEHIVAKMPESLPLLVYPNPARENITINYDIAEEGVALLTMFNINGQKIKDLVQINDAIPGSYSETMHVGDLPSGLYLVILVNNDKKEVFRVSVVH